MASKLTLVRTGPSSYLKLNAEDAKEWRKRNTEYSDGSADESVSVEEEQANHEAASDAKAVDRPDENKAVLRATEKKSRG